MVEAHRRLDEILTAVGHIDRQVALEALSQGEKSFTLWCSTQPDGSSTARRCLEADRSSFSRLCPAAHLAPLFYSRRARVKSPRGINPPTRGQIPPAGIDRGYLLQQHNFILLRSPTASLSPALHAEAQHVGHPQEAVSPPGLVRVPF